MSDVAPPNKRRQDRDVMKLMMGDHKVKLMDESSTSEFWVKFAGPKDTPYEGGNWRVAVELPKEYPYKSPSIGFLNRLYHPNIDDKSGSVCLDVINQTWSPMYDLVNIFEIFLPQLLRYANPSDPLNGEAAALMLNNPEMYEAKVKEYVAKFASEDFGMESDEDEHDREKSSGDIAMDDEDSDIDSDVSDMSDIDDDL